MTSSASFCLIVVFTIVNQYVSPSHQFEMDSIGRVVRSHLGTLYDLRSKLGGPSPSAPSTTTGASPTVQHYPKAQKSSQTAQQKALKESRGYAFHYSASDASLGSNGFHSRMGKVSESPSSSVVSSKKTKNSAKSYEKYAKLEYKTEGANVDPTINSFNIHEKSSFDFNNETTAAPSEIKTTSLPVLSPTAAPITLSAPSGINWAPLKAFTAGVNTAVTQVLTQKLMNLMDQDAPPSILNPFRHVVASGNRMVEFWDKRTVGRDGKSPGIVEVLGYGLDQLKKFRDGQKYRSSDIVSASTSASQAWIQGMLVVKKLTNRVLGYDTDEVAAVESRGGYGHDQYASASGWGGGGGGGWGHSVSHGSYGGLDTFTLLASLAFGAFLLQLLLTIINTSARSLDVSDLNTPLMMSDFHMPSILTSADNIFGTPTVRAKRSADGDDAENPFFSIVDKLDGAVKAYQQITEKPKCARLYLCRVAVHDAMADESSVLAKLSMLGLGHLSKDKSYSRFVKSIKSRVASGEDVNCDKIVKECLPQELN